MTAHDLLVTNASTPLRPLACRRKLLWSCAGAAIAVVLGAGTLVSVGQAVRATHAERIAQSERSAAVDERTRAVQARDEAENARRREAALRAKAEAAWRAGLLPIVCIGETLAEREAGRTLAVLETQLKGSVPAGATAATLVVAYEPVWAIGTGKTPTTPEVAAAHAHIRKVLGGLVADAGGVRLLYGGSVKGSNAAELLAAGDVDGALIGGASLKADEFLAIAKAA